MGRLKLNPKTQHRVATAVRAGASFEIAASQGRIGLRTHHDWMARGRAALQDADGELEAVTDPAERPYASYARAVEQARDAWELTQVREIERAGEGIPYVKTRQQINAKTGEVVTLEERGVEHDWRARAWLMERRNPSRWGKVTRTEVSGPEGGPVEVTSVEDLEAEALTALDELASRRARRVGGNGQAGTASTNGHG